MTLKETIDELLDLALFILEHTLSMIMFMLSVFVVGLAARYLLPDQPLLEDVVSYLEEGLFISLVGLLCIKMVSEAYKRWFPNGFPFKFMVA